MRVQIVDQHNRVVGDAPMPPAQIEAHTDDDGVIWTPPTAWAYFAACRARDAWCERAREAERHLATLVDANRGRGMNIWAAFHAAKVFLDSKMGIKS